MRKFTFQNEKYYHVYNRGVDKRVIFKEDFDYLRFIESIKEFNQIDPVYSLYLKRKLQKVASRDPISTAVEIGSLREKLVDMICYNLLPNHFHLLIRQKVDGGVSEFMKRLGIGYTSYFNKKNERSGALFQGRFKAVEVISNEQLNYICAYILGNSEIHKIETYNNYRWNSIKYLQQPNSFLCRVIEKEFDNINEFTEYLKEVIKNSSQIKDDKNAFQIE